MNCACGSDNYDGMWNHAYWCKPVDANEALASLRARLTNSPHEIGEGNVIFTRTDGKTVTFENVEVDSVSPVASAPGLVSFNYFGTDKIVHVPFVQSFTFEYRF